MPGRMKRRKSPPAISWRQCVAVLGALATSIPRQALAQELSDAQLDLVNARMTEGAVKSWELGTRAQAILEFTRSPYSVFSDTSLPPPKTIPDDAKDDLDSFFDIPRDIVSALPSTTSEGQPLMQDGSAADPASNGFAVLLAGWTGQDNGQLDYEGAARRQLVFLQSDAVPKTSDGAISHRADQLQLWNDFIFMVPPFLAYYGVITGNKTLLDESYNQIKLYRKHLRDGKTKLWRHVMLGPSDASPPNDPGFWATGEGWAAAGMLRVHATIKNSEFAQKMKGEQKDLAKWVEEIHGAVYKHLDDTNIFTNYIDRPASSSGNFYDAASTALIAATVYRASTHLGQHKHIRSAERSRITLFTPTDGTSSDTLQGYPHFSEDGWLQPVVNPHWYSQEGSKSGEGQAFVLMLHAAFKEWKDEGMQGSAASRSGIASRYTQTLTLMVGLFVLFF